MPILGEPLVRDEARPPAWGAAPQSPGFFVFLMRSWSSFRAAPRRRRVHGFSSEPWLLFESLWSVVDSVNISTFHAFS